MSSNIVRVCKIDEIKPHPDADKMELAIVGGWQCCVAKGLWNAGDLVTYVPPDSVMPAELSDRLGITKYLSNGRVRAANLRGCVSFGVVMPPYGVEGENVAEKLGITKYQPPLKMTTGDSESPDPAFFQYTDVENLRNFVDVLVPGEEVVVTEKIHGTNARVGLVRDPDGSWRRVAGSRTVQRRYTENGLYWSPFQTGDVFGLLEALSTGATASVILYGEIYGNVQSLRYGLKNAVAFRAFDVSVDGTYLGFDELQCLCAMYAVPLVPILYRGPYWFDVVKNLAEGKSVIAGADHLREGVVVKPVAERHNPATGRTILKYVSNSYLLGDWDGANE